MSGEGGDSRGGESGSRPTITLEDLDAFDEDDFDSDLCSSGGADGENDAMEEEGQDRLLNYWQDIGRVHHVQVPQGKRGRIVDLDCYRVDMQACTHCPAPETFESLLAPLAY